MATFSLLKMSAGGMYDQMGGGFHRYSVGEPSHQGLVDVLYEQDHRADVWAYRGVLPHCSSRPHAAHVMGVELAASYRAAGLPACTIAVLPHAQVELHFGHL